MKRPQKIKVLILPIIGINHSGVHMYIDTAWFGYGVGAVMFGYFCGMIVGMVFNTVNKVTGV